MALGTGVNASEVVGSVLLSEAVGVNVSEVVGSVLLTWDGAGVLVSEIVGSALLVPVFLNPPIWDPTLVFNNGYIANPYSQSGVWCPTGSSPITYSLNSGTLPPGLSVSSSGVTGTLSGTPTTLGTFVFTLKAVNAYAPSGVVSQSFSITISLPVGGGGGASWAFVT